MDVVSIGDVNVDIVTSSIPDYPARDSQLILDHLMMRTGGCAANFARACAGLGLKTRLFCKVGTDPLGDFLEGELCSVENLDARFSLGSSTGVSLAVSFDNAERSILTFPGANSEFSPDDVEKDLVSGKYLHLTGVFLKGFRGRAIELIDHAHDRGMIVSLDPALDPVSWGLGDKDLLEDVLRSVDIFLPNMAEAKALTGLPGVDDILDRLLSLGPSLVGLKDGQYGSHVASGEERIHVNAFETRVRDSVGAGDVYGAAFIYAYSLGWSKEETARFANAASALSISSDRTNRYPSCDVVCSFIRSSGRSI